MKMSWKKQKSGAIKRTLPLSRYPNLPFDQQQHQEEEEEEEEEVKETKNEVNDRRSEDRKNGDGSNKTLASASALQHSSDELSLAESFQSQGNKLAEDGRYHEALGKWEAALTLMPEKAILHEQKAQVLLEIGDAWNALKAATRANKLEPTWAEAWITLARAQLNFGEPDAAIESFDRALAIKPDLEEAKDDRQTALHLVKKRRQLHLSGLSTNENRYNVKDKEVS